MRRQSLLIALPLLIGLGACEEQSLEPSSLEEHVEMYPELLCAHSEECGPQEGWDFDSCMAKMAWSQEALLDFKDLQEQGIAVFDAQQGDACIEAIAVHQCPLVIEEERDGLTGLWLGIAECEGVMRYLNP